MDNNRYRLPTDRLINRLTPHYLSGRRYLLLLGSLVWPLQSLNDVSARGRGSGRSKHA